MALTRSQKKRALDWFVRKNAGRGCPVCGNKTRFKVETDASIFQDQRSMIHVVLIGCNKCGHLMTFNVSICAENVIDDEDEEDEEEEAEEG